MPVMVVVLGSCLGTISAALAVLLELGTLLALSAWLGCSAAGLGAALRAAR